MSAAAPSSPTRKTDAVDAASPVAAPRNETPPGSVREVPFSRLLIAFAAMTVGQFMAILDIQIVAASLPQIQAGISASAGEVSWIQTAYLIPEVVMIPLSGYLARLWGTQRVFLVSCIGFTIMSVLTGLSSSIDAMIITRALQGFIGGAMIPTIWSVIYTHFPPHRRITATVIMSLVVSMAPTIGPTLGGWLTENLSWRWLFFINVPPGLLVFFLVWKFGDIDQGDRRLAQGFDWWGLLLMAVFLMSMQYVLEEGAGDNWLQDGKIRVLSVLAVVCGAAFVWRTLSYRQPIVQLRAFQDWNFTLGVSMTFVAGMTLFGGTYLLPLFLGRIRGYSSEQVGMTMVVSGLVMLAWGPLGGRLVRTADPRIAMCLGFLVCAGGFWMGHAITAQWGFWEFAALQACRSVGVITAMIASQNLTMSTLRPDLAKSATSLINLLRNVGGAFGLAVLSTTLSQQGARHLHELSERTGPAAQGMIAGIQERMAEMGVADPEGAAYKAIFGMVQREAMILAYGDGFAFLTLACLIAAGLAVIARPAKVAPVTRSAH